MIHLINMNVGVCVDGWLKQHHLAQVRLIGLWAWGRYADAVQLHTDVCEINVHRLNQPSPTHTHTTENIYSNK